ncbi:lipid droplet-associated protein [Actinomycetospora sp. CA-101289]|uniref:lipid droplet-associated protein n=1 Tax=Actinomycetospora sp. CA-101289 TaxID=3239893 RepID=UPI003D973CE2
MSSLPFPVRVAAGLVVAAVEEARDLPRTVAGLPITAVSRVLQLGMRAQQVVTELAIKGDTALDGMRPVEEAPSWARFDDDLPEALPSGYDAYDADAHDAPGYAADLGDTPRRTNGHHAPALGIVGEAGATASVTPDALPGYETMTIAQLRGKLRALSIEQVTELLEWEQAHADRPPFVTMLTNRIATLSQQG